LLFSIKISSTCDRRRTYYDIIEFKMLKMKTIW
jgi:hypothetical protein